MRESAVLSVSDERAEVYYPDWAERCHASTNALSCLARHSAVWLSMYRMRPNRTAV